MTVEVFKTNVRYKRQAKMLLEVLSTSFPRFKINFDLEDCDKILRIEGKKIPQQKITALVTGRGYQCSVLE
ncbi:MAG: methyltransferase type 11 [Mucilaginibacter sp.]